MRFLSYSFFLAFILSACATMVKETMMADGNTWRVWVRDLNKCNGYSSPEVCVDALKPLVEKRSKEICSRIPYRLFACGKSVEGELEGVSCNVQCDDAATVKIKGADLEGARSPTPAASPRADENLLDKAKRCQAKGGVWVNNLCQIEIK